MKPALPYSKFPRVYDLTGADRHSAEMVDYTFKILHKFRIEATRGLDLCCGTGTAISLMADQGLSMSGLDGSAAMLAVAAKKLSGRKVPLYNKTLPKFRILDSTDSRHVRRFDLITCFYDSLNYLSNSRELKAAFRSVHRHLNDGGWFMFDMNTPAALKMLWGGQVYTGTRDDLAWVWTNKFVPGTSSATCHTTFFVKRGKLWERFDEEHVERAYDNKTIRRLLRETGFIIKGFYRCFSFERSKKNNYRICVVAGKVG